MASHRSSKSSSSSRSRSLSPTTRSSSPSLRSEDKKTKDVWLKDLNLLLVKQSHRHSNSGSTSCVTCASILIPVLLKEAGCDAVSCNPPPGSVFQGNVVVIGNDKVEDITVKNGSLFVYAPVVENVAVLDGDVFCFMHNTGYVLGKATSNNITNVFLTHIGDPKETTVGYVNCKGLKFESDTSTLLVDCHFDSICAKSIL
jgi:hypothetical protein